MQAADATAATTDFATARAMMVDSQVRPNKVTDARVIAAMRSLPRERFVPVSRQALAYSDEDVPLGGGRYLMEPMVIARLVQAAAVQAGERVLVVGAGSGYGAALLASCGAQVTALEQSAELLAMARAALAGIEGVQVVEGVLAAGWKAGAPYDAIMIEGAVPEVPLAIAAQLTGSGGRLVAVLRPGARMGQAVLCSAAGGGRLEARPLFDCAVPALPQMRREPGFVF
jgi:protein-L-isoaspartate(D-aspartate) O-methyltransferase